MDKNTKIDKYIGEWLTSCKRTKSVAKAHKLVKITWFCSKQFEKLLNSVLTYYFPAFCNFNVCHKQTLLPTAFKIPVAPPDFYEEWWVEI